MAIYCDLEAELSTLVAVNANQCTMYCHQQPKKSFSDVSHPLTIDTPPPV
jgi:3-deoxy-D-arabino-heptulosonate 7-phosphate (DAHP) synthase